jgi:hypothetical protein
VATGRVALPRPCGHEVLRLARLLGSAMRPLGAVAGFAPASSGVWARRAAAAPHRIDGGPGGLCPRYLRTASATLS